MRKGATLFQVLSRCDEFVSFAEEGNIRTLCWSSSVNQSDLDTIFAVSDKLNLYRNGSLGRIGTSLGHLTALQALTRPLKNDEQRSLLLKRLKRGIEAQQNKSFMRLDPAMALYVDKCIKEYEASEGSQKNSRPTKKLAKLHPDEGFVYGSAIVQQASGSKLGQHLRNWTVPWENRNRQSFESKLVDLK